MTSKFYKHKNIRRRPTFSKLLRRNIYLCGVQSKY